MKIGLLLVSSLLGIISCTTQAVCDDIIRSDAVIAFKVFNSEPAKDTLVSGVSVFGIREGLPDSLLYDSSTTSRILLPLDPHHEFSRFVLQANENADTLRILHTTESYLISYSCGFASMFTLENVEYSIGMIQDFEIINSVIDAELEQDEEHLWIFF